MRLKTRWEPSVHLGPRFGMVRCSKRNCVHSDSESGTGIGVVAGFSGIAGIITWPHLKMAALVLGRQYLQML